MLFLSCLKPLFHSKAKCKAIDIKIFFYSHANKPRKHIEIHVCVGY